MTIVTAGLNRTAALAESTWTQMKIGTGTTTSDISDTDLETSLFIKVIGIISTSANVIDFKATFSKTDASSASNITEIAIFDSATSFMLFHTIASTNTWTSFAKNSTNNAVITTYLTVTA